MFRFDLQRFGKGSTTTYVQSPAVVQEPTAEQTRLAQLNIGQVEALQPTLNKAIDLTNNALNQQQVTPDYVGMYNSGLNGVNAGVNSVNQASDVANYYLQNGNAPGQGITNNAANIANNELNQSAGYATQAQSNLNDLANGKLSDGYIQAMQAATTAAMNPYTTGLNSLAKSGVFNSSQNDRYMNQASQALGNAANLNFNANLNTAAGLNQAMLGQNNTNISNVSQLGQQQYGQYGTNLSNASTLANQRISAAAAPINYGAAAQQASTAAPLSYMSLFTGGYQPQQNMYGQLLNQQTALSAPAINQAVVSQPESPWGAIGSIAGAFL